MYDYRGLTSAYFDAIIDGSIPRPPHVRVLAKAMRYGGLRLACVAPGQAGDFRLKGNRPTVCLILDDLEVSCGPTAFCRKSLRRVIKAAASAAVVVCEPPPGIYAAVAEVAIFTRKPGLIVETQLDHEADWMNLIRDTDPSLPLILATVKAREHA